MDCPVCDASTLPFPVPAEYREHLPGDDPGAAICTECLTLSPIEEPPDEVPDFQAISDAFPRDPAAALPMVVVVGLLENLALNRSEIATLLERVEREGADPMLVLDRLACDGSLDPAVDLRGRRRQLEQLL